MQKRVHCVEGCDMPLSKSFVESIEMNLECQVFNSTCKLWIEALGNIKETFYNFFFCHYFYFLFIFYFHTFIFFYFFHSLTVWVIPIVVVNDINANLSGVSSLQDSSVKNDRLRMNLQRAWERTKQQVSTVTWHLLFRAVHKWLSTTSSIWT